MAAKERYEKVSRDRQFLMEEFQRIELDLKRALKKKKKALLEKMWVLYIIKTKHAPFSREKDPKWHFGHLKSASTLKEISKFSTQTWINNWKFSTFFPDKKTWSPFTSNERRENYQRNGFIVQRKRKLLATFHHCILVFMETIKSELMAFAGNV